MLFYMTIAALFLFTAVMSAVIGFLMHQAIRRLTASRAARHTTGAAAVNYEKASFACIGMMLSL